MEWGRRALQSLVIDAFHHGEIAPYRREFVELGAGKPPKTNPQTLSFSSSYAKGEDMSCQTSVSGKDEPVVDPSLLQVEQTEGTLGAMAESSGSMILSISDVPEIAKAEPESSDSLPDPVSEPVSPVSFDLAESISNPEPALIKKVPQEDKISCSPEGMTDSEIETISQSIKATPSYSTHSSAVDDLRRVLLQKVLKNSSKGVPPQVVTTASVQVDVSEEPVAQSESVVTNEDKTENKKEQVLSSAGAKEEYCKGDYSSLVGFPPKIRIPGGISRLESTASESTQGQQSRYNSFIISSTVDYRLLSSCQLSAELRLQTIAQSVYDSILNSLIHARPGPSSSGLGQPVHRTDQVVFDRGMPFGKTTELFVRSIESLLEKAKLAHSNVSLIAVFEFWNELNSLVPISSPETAMKYKAKNKKDSFSHSSPKEKETVVTECSSCSSVDIIPPLCSRKTLNLLLDTLLETSSTSPKLWQLGLTLTNMSIKFITYFPPSEESVIDYEHKLSSVLVKLFSLNFVGAKIDGEVLKSLFETICSVQFQNEGTGGPWSGVNFLLDILVTLLRKG